MTAQAATITPEVQAANDYRFLEMSKKFFKTYGLKHPDTVPMLKKALKEKCEELSLALAMHDQEPSNEAMAMMQETLGRNVKGLWKVVQQFKNSQPYLDLVAEFEPTLEVTGGNQMGQVISVGTTAKEVASPIKEDWLSKLPVVTDTPQDLLKAHGLTKAGKPAKGGKGTKAAKTAKEKPAKKEKVAKSKPALPLPTIASIAELEALDRKGLQQAMSALNTHKVTGVKGNATSDAIKVALAKELLGLEGYVPAPKTEKVKGSKAPEAPLEMPQGISWEEVKGMSYRQLQQFCKVLRSNGLFEGNVGGAGSGKEILLSKAADAMRQLGHDIQALEISAQNPDSSKPQLERSGAKASLIEKANQGLATHAALGVSPDWQAVMAG